MKYGKTAAKKNRGLDGRKNNHLRTRTNLKAGSGGNDVYTVTIPVPQPAGVEMTSVTFPAP